MGNGDGDCFPPIRSGHPEDVPTDRQILHAIHADVHRILEAISARLERAAGHLVEYWDSLEDGEGVDGLIDAMRVLADATGHEGLARRIAAHDAAGRKA